MTIEMHEFDDAPVFDTQRRYAGLDVVSPFRGTHAHKIRGFAQSHLSGLRKFLVGVKMPDTEVSPAQKRLEVSKLQNPRPDAAARGIVAFLLQEDRQEHFLEDVFGFCFVTDDAEGDGENLTAVAMKQQRETVRTTLNYVPQQVIVRERIEMLMRRH